MGGAPPYRPQRWGRTSTLASRDMAADPVLMGVVHTFVGPAGGSGALEVRGRCMACRAEHGARVDFTFLTEKCVNLRFSRYAAANSRSQRTHSGARWVCCGPIGGCVCGRVSVGEAGTDGSVPK